MTVQNVGILHPGAMGIFVAVSAQNSGNTVYWVSQGRGPQTRARADKYNLRDAKTLAELCEICVVIVSVCPPAAAEEVARQVLAHSFKGLYLDANAISPQRAIRIGQAMRGGGARFVDGGIIGGPSWDAGKTWLYLSGEDAEEAAACFSEGPIQPRVIGKSVGKASALKMCYAAYNKGATALLCAVLATAQALDVRNELEAQWSEDSSKLAEQAKEKTRRVTAKAWRFAGEMDEIASTFREAGLPGEFHTAAAMIYRRMAGFKDAPTMPALDQVLQVLIETSDGDS